MGKAEIGTPKWIANKMKAKGLQKLRWYCQMCQKQCRDENGFKCHISSESHQRQLLIFADNSSRYLGAFSKEFSDGYLEILKRQFGTKRVNANKVYQEYISDRNHLHMNATQWTTLTGFVKYLGRTGKCIVDETEKGWFITYIDRDPEMIKLQEQARKKEKMNRDDNERMQDFLEKQIKKGLDSKLIEENQPSDLVRSGEEPITLDLKLMKKPDITQLNKAIALSAPLKFDSEAGPSNVKSENQKLIKKEFNNKIKIKKEKDEKSKRKLTALEQIIKEEDEKRKRIKRTNYWLSEDIVVKVITKSLGEKYQNKKGVVEQVMDKYAALVRIMDNDHKLKLDQAHLQTVIPAIGRKLKILNGGYRDLIAELLEIDADNFCVNVKILSGPLRDKTVKKIPYEEVSKLYEA